MPHSLKGININNFPFYWMVNIATLFIEWFHNFLVQDIKRKNLWPDVVEHENSRLLLQPEYSQLTDMKHIIGGGFVDFTEADIVELMANKELNENDLADMVNDK
ncbi:hypothetical protein CEXT_623551 [Caerostris extrusa]|uniref:Uncharacterized protein n=1 Tax=Caerostris extrusa TaxID=172846 RepID=A0AAV4M7F8_CAEEX|nr:hypothetical protein CEXT_623551 [Caerostris extrusa]